MDVHCQTFRIFRLLQKATDIFRKRLSLSFSENLDNSLYHRDGKERSSVGTVIYVAQYTQPKV